MHTHFSLYSFTEATENTFEIAIDVANERVRRRLEVINLGWGLLLCQYRCYSDYEFLTISIKFAGKHVSKSPYTVKNVLHEDCYCPLRSTDQWLADFKCPQELDPQIDADLKHFRKDGINITALYERGGELFSRTSFIHYSIVDHKVW